MHESRPDLIILNPACAGPALLAELGDRPDPPAMILCLPEQEDNPALEVLRRGRGIWRARECRVHRLPRGIRHETAAHRRANYGSRVRFSVKDTHTTKTRNFYTVTADACLACHTDAKYAAMP